MAIKYLVGATKNNEIVFVEFGVKNRNGRNEFAASFDTVTPFNASEIDLVKYYEDWIDGLDKEYLYDYCCDFDCAPSELAENLADECCDIRDAMDCSLYDEMIDVDGDDWCFESCCCGQHDTTNEMICFTNEDAYNEIMNLWKKHHLKEVDDDIVDKVEELKDSLCEIDEEAWISDYIRANLV